MAEDGMTPGAGLRRAGPGDAGAVRDLVRAAYSKWVERLGRDPKPMGADYEVAVREHRVDLMEAGGAVLALIEMRVEADHLLVVNVAVSPACQGLGYGRALLRHAEEVAREAGVAEMRLYTSALLVENVRLYRRVGYVVEREEVVGDRGVFVFMRKGLG